MYIAALGLYHLPDRLGFYAEIEGNFWDKAMTNRYLVSRRIFNL